MASGEIIQFEHITVKINRRLFQRSINILLKPCGEVKVTAGKTTSQKSILSFLETQKKWLLSNLKIIEDEKSKFPDISYKDNDRILFIGKFITLKYINSNLKRVKCKITQNELQVFVNSSCQKADIVKGIKNFYKKSGIEVLKKIVNEQSEIMNLFPTKLSFRAQKTRWGSCSSDGGVSLNWKLILCPPEVIEYVVIHELAHLQHQNHSQNFWNLVGRYSPDYKEHTKWLKTNNYQIEKYKLS